MMVEFSAFLLALSTGASSEVPSVASASIAMDERTWSIGRLPTLTFTVSPSRGPFEKVVAFVYVSEEPQAFFTSPYPPQFVGVLLPPTATQVVIERPERGPINAFTREKFVQGALFDARTGALVAVTNEDYLDIHYDSAPVSFTLDFETADDFVTPLVNGQNLSRPPAFGALVALGSLQPSSGAPHQGPAIFDSTPGGPNAASSDPDLLVGSRNLVILQENPGEASPGIFDFPDDSANGGTLVFEFTGFNLLEKVELVSIDLVDIDSGSPGPTRVVLTDVLDRTRTYVVPPGWTEDISFQGPPGIRRLDLSSLDPQPGFLATATASEAQNFIPGEVVSVTVELAGSGGVDNLRFLREADPTTPVPARVRRSGPRGPR